MLEPAPGLLSTTTCWPRIGPAAWLYTRATTSAAEPGGEADDEMDRPRRIGVLRGGETRERRQRGGSRSQMQKSATRQYHDGPPQSTFAERKLPRERFCFSDWPPARNPVAAGLERCRPAVLP